MNFVSINLKGKRLISILCSTLIVMSCQHSDQQNPRISDSVEESSHDSFPFPEIPTMLSTAEDRKAYLLTHYWEQLDFADTTLVNNRDVTGQGFVNFIALLAEENTPEELIRESLKNWSSRFLPEIHAR